jgi:VWFA-related protein
MFYQKTLATALCACSALLWPVFLVRAQQEEAFKLNVDVDLTELHVTVTDGGDRPIGNLARENFRVFEDLIEQKISIFKHEDVPVSLGLLIDNSRSIEPRKKRLDTAAVAFVQRGNPEDEIFIVHFDDRARLTLDFTDNVQDLERALVKVRPFGQTAIYDALILATQHMAKAKHAKKAILLITDGLDNSSHHTITDAIEAAKRSGVAIYTVGLLSALEGQKAEDTLTHLAETSGGRAFFPEDVEQARTSMERVARDLREQYLLGYFSSNPRNGAWRSIRLEITRPLASPPTPRLVPSYRRGYYGPAN